MNPQNNPMNNSNETPKKEKPWLKIFLVIIAILLVMNGVKSCASSVFGGKSKDGTSTSSADTYKSKKIKVKNTIDVESIETAEISVDGIVQNSTNAEAASFITYTGHISADGQEDTYEFTPSIAGTYRFDLTGIVASSSVTFQIINSLDERVVSESLSNNEGVTIGDLVAGQTYRIVVAQSREYCDYTLTIGQQKQEIDISGYTSISDSTEFTDQKNIYYYTIPEDGRLRLQVDGLQGSAQVSLLMWDSLEQNIVNEYCASGEGVTVKDLVAGDVYQIQVRQASEFSPYTLNIFGAKATVDISEFNVVHDSIEFVDQRNVYTMVPKTSGDYRFEFSDIQAGTSVLLRVFDSNGQQLVNSYCGNEEGETAEGLEEGKEYQVQVVQYNETGKYTLNIGAPKPVIEIEPSTMVNDTIQYTGQCNTYTLNAKAGKSYVISFSNLMAEQDVTLVALDELGYELEQAWSANEGDSITIGSVEKDQKINIKIYQNNGIGDYSITVLEQ